MLMEIGPWGFARLAFALLLFSGPGCALFSLYPARDKFDKTQSALLMVVFAASFWIVLMPLLLALDLRLSALSAGIIAAAGWVTGIVLLAPRRAWIQRPRWQPGIERTLLLAITGGVLAAGLYVLRAKVVGAGSDSYHHSLFAQMIVDQGRLPVDYSPYTDQVITFTYHYGFHLVTALIGWFSGLPAYQVVLLMAPLLTALSALAAAFLAESITASPRAGLAAALVTGVVCVFPAFMFTWGRYPQVAALVLLSVWMVLFKQQLDQPVDPRRGLFCRAAFLGLLGAAIGGMHYRVALMALLSAFTLLVSMILTGNFPRKGAGSLLGSLVVAGAAAVLLFAPWAVHVIFALRQGFSVPATISGADFYSFSRVGRYVLQYPTNVPLLAACAAAALWGLLARDWRIIWLVGWVGLGFLIALSRISGVFMDPVSMLISLYLPVSVAVGWLSARVDVLLPPGDRLLRGAALALAAVFVLWSAPMGVRNLSAGDYYVVPDDLRAIAWVRENTPADALFMVNLFHFKFSAEQIIATDAGYWLPLLADRKTVSLPMPFLSERFRDPQTIDGLKRLDALNGKLCSPEAAAALEEQRVSHVFIGSAGGRLSAEELAECSFFVEEFHYNNSYVYRFSYRPAAAP